MKVILSQPQFEFTICRLAHQIMEHANLQHVVIVGLQPRGVLLADKIMQSIKTFFPDANIPYGKLDITFYRDDIRKELHKANQTNMPFTLEDKEVVLIDDVLYTGRTIRAALDALLDYGRPQKVSLCVLIDRRFSRQLPIQADFVGKYIDSIISQKVKVKWQPADGADEVLLLDDM